MSGQRPRLWRWGRVPAAALLLLGPLAGCGSGPVAGPPTTAATGVPAPAPSPTGSTAGVPSPPATAPTAAPTVAPTAPTAPSSGPTAAPAPGTPTSGPSGPAPVDPRLAGRDWERIPTSARVVALTFDAGANADAVPAILAALQAAGAPATFFLTGRFVAGFPAASRSIVAAGHRLGNHSIDHPYFTRLTGAEIRRQVLTAAAQIRAATGRSPSPLFRFPYGDRDSRTIAAVNAAGYVPVRWTVDTLGWRGTSGGQSPATVLARVLAGLGPGEIVLMHVGSHPTDRSTVDAAALPSVLAAVRARGYRFVTLDALR